MRFLLLNFFLCLCDEGLKEEEFLDKHYCDKVFFRAHVASAQETRAHAHLSLSLSVLDIYIYILMTTQQNSSITTNSNTDLENFIEKWDVLDAKTEKNKPIPA